MLQPNTHGVYASYAHPSAAPISELQWTIWRRALRVLVGIGIGLSLAGTGMTQTPPRLNAAVLPGIFKKKEKKRAESYTPFKCKSVKLETPKDASSKHTVTLSWKASTSLTTPPAAGDGYNLYRLNPDGSCTKLNADPIRATVYEDRHVILGRHYRYAATTVKHNMESGPSEIIEVKIPTE